MLDADLRVLLMCLVHLTGDRSWLEPPFTPRRDVRLIADEGAGLPADVADRIRSAVVEAAVGAARAPMAIGDPGDELMVEMMSVCLGEQVPDEYAPMMREELGFASRDVVWPTDAEAQPGDVGDVLVVGAGVSGIALGVRLGRLGIGYSIVEQAADLGGVWRDNRYPGCGVDTPNHAYSFSFAPPNRWSRFFAPQPEIETYVRRTADDCGVTDHIEFRTKVVAARWNDADRVWEVTLETPTGREVRRCRYLVSAIGQLNRPKLPDLDLTTFDGPCFHSAVWPDGLDVRGRRVAVIGTGASAMQIVPSIVDDVAALTIVQRSPQWARPIPRYHEPIPPGSQWLFAHLPGYAAWFRFTMLWRYGDGLLPFLRKDPDWPHPDRSLNRVNERHRVEMIEHIRSELADRPDLIDRCVPDYPPYGKRILLDNGWYAALRRSNVELVASGVERLTNHGVVTADGVEHPADVVVFATGFEVTGMAAALDITGRDGIRLADVWADENPTAYLGITVPQFPNLFCLQGPNTGLGHGGSAIFQSECQARHITACLAHLAAADASTIEPTPGATDAYVAAVDAEHEHLIWTHPGMDTYYRNRAGRVVSVMPWRLVDYWRMTHDVDAVSYRVE